MDTENNHIGIYSDDVDAKGRPLKQWELNVETGHITETERDADGNEVRIHHKEVDPATLERDSVVEVPEKAVEEISGDIESEEISAETENKEVAAESTAAAATTIGAEWDDLEK
jgi:hypothetical protein